jgi:hypothetical protein
MAVMVTDALIRIKASGSTPLFVNAKNAGDYSAVRKQLVTHRTLKLSNYFEGTAQLPNDDKMLADIKRAEAPVLVLGLPEYLAFKDAPALQQTLSELGKLNKRVIVLCSHLDTLLGILSKDDVRFRDRIIIIDGAKDVSPSLTLSAFSIKTSNSFETLKECLASIEENGCLPSMVISELSKRIFERSLWPVKTIGSAYDAIAFITPNFSENFDSAFGTEEQWLFLYSELLSNKDICLKNFGVKSPEDAVSNYFNYVPKLKWLLLYLLKSSIMTDYCTLSAKKAESIESFIEQLYCGILAEDRSVADFESQYIQRKRTLKSLLDESEMQKFVNLSDILGKEKIHYLTDLTELEQKEFIKCITAYDYSFDELTDVLERNFPLLADYLSPYYFDIPFWRTADECGGNETLHDLGEYFERYKHQKLKNKLDDDFVKLVDKLAVETPRKFIVELPARSMVMPAPDHLIWIDALGVEFLGYIVRRCDALDLKADIKIARAEMPTITTPFNNRFFNESRGDKKVRALDDLKHSGTGEYDYSKTKLPLYIVDELKIIKSVLKKAKAYIKTNPGQSVVIVSDHGASRLARIYEKAITVDADVDVKYGGRCCVWKDGLNNVSPYASDNENGYCVLANYDRFAGGRYTGVELHGGAALEEIVVPIITLSAKNPSVTAIFNKPDLKYKVTRGKAEEIVVTLSVPVSKLRLRVGSKFYAPIRNDNTTYAFKTDISQPQRYIAALLDDNQIIKSNIALEFVSAVGGTTDLFS